MDSDSDGGDDVREAVGFRLRHPSRNLDDRLSRLESVCLDHEERLQFLDPQLKSTHSRIDAVESICDANTNDLIKMKRDQGPVLKKLLH
jgi:hypothetical protein